MPPAPCSSDFHGIEPNNFQACFDYWTARNYWPETLSVNVTLAGSFQPGSFRTVHVYMNGDQFQEQFNQQAAAGCWPHQISATSGGYTLEEDFTLLGLPITYDKKYIQPLFSCIWKPVAGPVETRFLTVDDFAKKNQEMANEGFVLHDLCGYTTDASVKGIRMIATWTTRPHGAWTTMVNMTKEQAVAKFNELTPKGYQVTRFTSYWANDKRYYAAVYEQVPNAGEWYHYFNMNADQYQARYNQLAPRNLPLRHICNQGERYSVIWGR